MTNHNILKFTQDKCDEPSIVDDARARCHDLQVQCQIGDHRSIIKAYLYATAFTNGNRFITNYLFSELAGLLHETTQDDVDEWYDRYIEIYGEDVHDVILSEVRENIESNAFSTFLELRTALEMACCTDIHRSSEKIFEIAFITAKLGILEIQCNLATMHPLFLRMIADRYVDVVCALIPFQDQD